MGYDKDNDIERIFRDEVREKKRTASGVHGMTGKRGHVGKMMFPIDYKSSKERKEYMKGSEVIVYNLYHDINKIPDWDEVKNSKEKIELLRKNHTSKELLDKWKIKEGVYRKAIKELGVVTRKRVVLNKKGMGRITNTTIQAMVDKEKALRLDAEDEIRELKEDFYKRVQEYEDKFEMVDDKNTELVEELYHERQATRELMDEVARLNNKNTELMEVNNNILAFGQAPAYAEREPSRLGLSMKVLGEYSSYDLKLAVGNIIAVLPAAHIYEVDFELREITEAINHDSIR